MFTRHGLNMNFHRLMCLNSWFLVGGAIREGAKTFRKWCPVGESISLRMGFGVLEPGPILFRCLHSDCRV